MNVSPTTFYLQDRFGHQGLVNSIRRNKETRPAAARELFFRGGIFPPGRTHRAFYFALDLSRFSVYGCANGLVAQFSECHGAFDDQDYDIYESKSTLIVAL